MGRQQPLRGNPESKLLYVIDQLIGGINTDFSDDVSPDNEFNSIVNFSMDKRGSLFKRKGFGKLNALSEIFNMFTSIPDTKGKTPENPNPENTNDNIVYMKLLKNDNGCFRNLSAFTGDKAYRNYQAIYGAQNNTWELLMITTSNYLSKSTAWIFKCTLPPLQYDASGNPTSVDTIQLVSTKIELPVLFKWNRNLKNIETIEYFDKIYFTDNNKGLVVFDRSDNSFSYNGTGITGKTNMAYKPNAMEIRKVGFNVLGDDPLHWVDFQGISTDSIQGIYLTTTDNIPLQIIPAGGIFRLNVLYTGSDSGFSFIFKEGETELTFDSAINTSLSTNGLKVYDITLKTVPTTEAEIKVEKTGSTIDPYYDYYQIGSVDTEVKVIQPLNVGEMKNIEIYNRAVYYSKDTIWFSEINTFNYVPNYNYVSLPIEPTDEITKIVFFRNVYIVFTKYRIYKMMGSFGSNDFQIIPLNLSIGCHAPETVVPVENVLYFASPRGLYQLISSAGYSASNMTFENVKEIDTKVKSLTSDITMYLGEQTDPAVRYNGISEKAVAIRYKDKYMLFYNTAFLQGDMASLKNLDVLVYQYELRAFSQINFPIKPTFLFMVDGAIETFCTIPEKEELTKEEVLVNYNFETQSDGRVVTDLSSNKNDGNLIGGTILAPGKGLRLDGLATTYAKAGILGSDVNLKNGFNVILEASISTLSECKLFSLKQATPTGSAKSDTFSLYTDWAHGFRGEFVIETVPNVAGNKNLVKWKYRHHRSSVSDADSGTITSIKLKNTTDNVDLVSLTNKTYTMGNELVCDVATGQFTVSHSSTGSYSKIWKSEISSFYKTSRTEWQKGPNTSFDTTQSTEEPWIKIRFAGTAVAYDGGCTITYTPFVINDYALYNSARNLYIWINGTQKTHGIPAIQGAGLSTSGGQQQHSINYNGQPTIFIDGQYNAQATLNGIYYANLNVPGFNFTLPKSQQVTIVEDVAYTTSGTSTVTLSDILLPSYREISLGLDASKNISVSINSEFGSGKYSPATPVDVLGKHKYELAIIKSSDGFIVNLLIDDINVLNANIKDNFIVNGTRDNNTIGNSLSGIIYSFNVLVDYNKEIQYDFDEGKSSILVDKSNHNRNGSLFGTYNWITESGLLFDGSTGYVILPEFSSKVLFSNGFTIEFEAKFEDITRNCKIFDLATSYGSGNSYNDKCSINSGSIANSDKIDFMTSSIDRKTYKISNENSNLSVRTKWKFVCSDNGKSYDLVLYKNNVEVSREQYNYGGITNIVRKSNFIGKSNSDIDNLFKGMLYNFKITINASANPVPIYVGSMFEYDTTYDDFGRSMKIESETKGINLQYPMHTKKLKNVFIKGLGGFNYNNFFFELYSDGHLVNDPKIYNCYIDEVTKQVVYDYTEDKKLSFNEMISLLGNMRLDKTRLGQSTYETRKVVIPAKGKNFTIKIYGESGDHLGIESFGFVYKLGKVKEE